MSTDGEPFASPSMEVILVVISKVVLKILDMGRDLISESSIFFTQIW
jgi:hypothetical protein